MIGVPWMGTDEEGGGGKLLPSPPPPPPLSLRRQNRLKPDKERVLGLIRRYLLPLRAEVPEVPPPISSSSGGETETLLEKEELATTALRHPPAMQVPWFPEVAAVLPPLPAMTIPELQMDSLDFVLKDSSEKMEDSRLLRLTIDPEFLRWRLM